MNVEFRNPHSGSEAVLCRHISFRDPICFFSKQQRGSFPRALTFLDLISVISLLILILAPQEAVTTATTRAMARRPMRVAAWVRR